MARPLVSIPGRNLAEIAGERAGIVARLARVTERTCGDRCAAVRIERATLNARLVALDAESAEVRRHELALDRADAERAAAKADPVAGLLIARGVSDSRLDVAVSLAFAVVLEGVACFCWLLALRPAGAPASAVTPSQELSHCLVTRVTSASTAVPPVMDDTTEAEGVAYSSAADWADEVTRVLTAIRDGTLRGTVTKIRKYLGCSQAKAAALRKRIAATQQDRVAVR